MKQTRSEVSCVEATMDGSESNGSNNPNCSSKRLKLENPTSSTRFKGVVLQQNGHWGAQIYTNHQRIWLGTFKTEKAAAMAYDSAAIKFRSSDSHRNFPWTNLTIQEPSFQDLYTAEVVLNMIKDGSYESKFADYVQSRSSKATEEVQLDPTRGFINQEGVLCQQLFQKELTPSDVGKLNRLVIPKKYAVKYFPLLPESIVEGDDNNDGGGGGEEVQLVFLDRKMRAWKFRYCYWKSSQSFVFTRGWNRFVKDKELKAKDIVTFYKCEYRGGLNEGKAFCMIDVGYTEVGNPVEKAVGEECVGDAEKVELKLCLGGGSSDDGRKKVEEDEEEEDLEEFQVENKKALRLFGVNISCGSLKMENKTKANLPKILFVERMSMPGMECGGNQGM